MRDRLAEVVSVNGIGAILPCNPPLDLTIVLSEPKYCNSGNCAFAKAEIKMKAKKRSFLFIEYGLKVWYDSKLLSRLSITPE